MIFICFVNQLSSSLELQQPHLWESTSPVPAPTLTKNQLLSDVVTEKTKTGCLGCATWPRTIAFVLVLILLAVVAIALPILLINNLITSSQITSTTETETSNIFFLK